MQSTTRDDSLAQTSRDLHVTFRLGDRVRKKKGSAWHGVIVGFYSTSLNPEGYCVESEREPGSVQIYPVAALELNDA
jgi:dihydrofolate reductase (trimethoprim resistance protein)